MISAGVRYFFSLLHFLHAGTQLDALLFPPRTTGRMWSMVNSLAEKLLLQ